MIRRARLWAFVAVASLLPGFSAHGMAAETSAASPIFQIGQFDRSSGEFAGGSPAHAVDFVAGTSTAKDWYAVQEAVLASATGTPSLAAAPRNITFTIEGSPARSYRLHIAVLIETSSVPVIRIGIDGKHGLFYLHPQLDLNAGDTMDVFNAIYSHADVVFDIPSSDLHQGKNTISLSAVEEAAEKTPDAGIYYDAISLAAGEPRGQDAQSPARIVPTVFYRQQAAGLEELIDAFIRFEGSPKAGGNVELTVGGRHYRQSVAGHEDFGEQRFEFAVPEFTTPAEAELTWTSAGRQRHLSQKLQPAKKWTLYLVPHIHLDIGYSDYQAKVAAIQSRVFDEAMDFTQKHPDFRFSTDGEWNLEQFFKTRTPEDTKRLVTAIQNRQIFIPAEYANLLTGFPTAETLIRSLYPSANFSRLHGTPFNYANITDVPSYSWSYASILASAGLKDFIAGSDNYRAPVLLRGRLQYKSPMWWVGPDGQKVLLWYSRHYMQMQFLFGLPPVVPAGRETLPLFLQMYEDPGYRADATILFGSQVENTDLFPKQASLAGDWNAVYAYPKIVYSGFHDALEKIAQQFGGDLPTIRGDGGPYWEDGIASDAFYAAMERGNESRGPSAEKLETVASLVGPGVAPDKAGLDRMWRNMVTMDEHTFTSFNSVSQPRSQLAIRQLDVKNQMAVRAHGLADWLVRNSMASIVDRISAGENSLIVFNMLNWRRDGLVTTDLSDGMELVDESNGQVVPAETVFEGKGFRRARFLARDVPAVGYKVYRERKAERKAAAPETSSSTTIESPYYRVVLDPSTGAIKSIYDKQLQRELVNQASPYRFGQYLYVTGGDKEPNTLLQYRPISSKPELTVHPAHAGSLVSVTRAPYGWVATMKSSDANTPDISTQVRLFDGEKKIEIVENLDKKKVLTKEGVYFAFPFAMDHPRFQYEIQNGVVDPAKDMYAGAGRVWFSVQHWVSVEENGVSGTVMPLDAGLVTLGDINRGDWPTEFGERPGTIFSYIMNNYWNTNYAAGQGGHFRFRYVVTSSGATDAAKLSRMGWEEMTPLEADKVTSQDKALDTPRPLSGKEGSFLTLEDPAALLDTWKSAEDGKGAILRILDLGGADRTVTLRTPLLNLSRAWLTDAVERNKQQLPLADAHSVSFPIHPHEILTLRLESNPPAQ